MDSALSSAPAGRGRSHRAAGSGSGDDDISRLCTCGVGSEMACGAYLETPKDRLTRFAADGAWCDHEPPRLTPGRWADKTLSMNIEFSEAPISSVAELEWVPISFTVDRVCDALPAPNGGGGFVPAPCLHPRRTPGDGLSGRLDGVRADRGPAPSAPRHGRSRSM